MLRFSVQTMFIQLQTVNACFFILLSVEKEQGKNAKANVPVL